MKPNSIAIFHSNDEVPYSGDMNFKFRQNPDLFWLTGIDQEETMLILFPDCPRPEYREVLFLKPTNEVIAVWEGHKYTMPEAKNQSGCSTILWNTEFQTIVDLLMVPAENVYLNLNENDRAKIIVPYRDLRYANEMQQRFPLHNYVRSAPIMHKLRSIKSDAEVELIKQSCGITKKAFDRVLKFVKPGVMEYEIEAEIMHEFLRNRATSYSYYPIIASGNNSNVLHYNDNNQECKAGDLILLDFGSEYANYAADLTRTIPVSGKFTARQKDVYNAVLRVMKAAMNMLRPGTVLHQYNMVDVGKVMEEELIKLGLLKAEEVKKQDPEKPLYKKYFMHGTSHFMGIDVHDVGNRFVAIQAGNVFTCEPGIYIPEEGFGIRIENDVLVTDGAPIDLMADIPIEADHIEELMNAGK